MNSRGKSSEELANQLVELRLQIAELTEREAELVRSMSAKANRPGQPTEQAVHLSDDDDFTETIDLRYLVTEAMTTSGSFDLRPRTVKSLAKLLNALPMRALLVDEGHSIVFSNKSWGIAPLRNGSLRGKPLSAVFASAGAASKIRSLVRDVFADRKTRVTEAVLGARERRIWGRIHLCSLRLEQKRLVLVIIEDLTAEKNQLHLTRLHQEELRKEIDLLKLTQEQLRQSKERLDLAMTGADLGFWHWNLQTDEIFLSDRTYEMGGYSRGELDPSFSSWQAIMHPEDKEAEARVLLRHLEGSSPMYESEYRFMTKSGQWKWVLARGKVLARDAGGKPLQMSGTLLDITERKQAEQALKRSEERYRSLVDLSPDGVAVYANGKVVFANDAVAKMIGSAHPRELVNKPVLDFVHPDCKEVVKARVLALLEEGKPQPFLEEKFVRLDGTPCDVEVAAVPISYQGKPAVQVVIRDVTERKKAESLILQAERLRAVADLASGVAHNFNNLLQVILGGLDLTLLDLKTGDLSDIKNRIERLIESTRFGAETVRRLQRFAQVRRDMKRSETKIVDLSELAGQAIEMTKPWWKTNPEKEGIMVALKSRLPKGCLVSGEESELFEVLVNLIKNAAEALPAGGDIEVWTSVKQDQVVLEVRDTGVGIRKDHLKRMFDPFWSTKGSAGTGMGLAVSHGIITRHHGEITVKSAEGKGSTFTVRLPLAKEPCREPEPAAEKTLDLKLTILAIDDMVPILMLLEQIFVEHGQKVFVAASGEQGLRIFRDNPIDLVICDLGMPEMNGWDVGKQVWATCQEKGIPKTPFILLTGWGGEFLEEEKISESGIDAVLEKPLQLRALLDAVQDVVSKRRSQGPRG